MKKRGMIQRRRLIAAAGASGLLAAASAAPAQARPRLYGAPASVAGMQTLEQDRFRLGLARADIPPDAWDICLALAKLAEDVYNDPAVAERFRIEPQAYLSSIGYPTVNLVPTSREALIMLALENQSVRQAVTDNDAPAFVRALDELGILARVTQPAPAELGNLIRGALSQEELQKLDVQLDLSDLPQTTQDVFGCIDVAAWAEGIVVAAILVAAAAIALALALATPTNSTSSSLPSAMALALGDRVFATKVQQELVETYTDIAIDALFAVDDPTTDPLRNGNQTALREIVRSTVERQVLGYATTDLQTYLPLLNNAQAES